MSGRAAALSLIVRIRRGPALARLWAALLFAVLGSAPAFALKPIQVSPDQDRIEITSLGEFYESRGDSLQLEMAAASDAVAGRMTVRAATAGTNPNWIAFALQNTGDKPIERWLTAERYTMFGSGAIWPDLDARRIEAVTPSLGFVPERIRSDRADIFRITLEPGQTITYVAELSTERYARVYLWKPIDYELKVRDRQLFNGVLLGFVGLLAVFLTAVFAANHKAIFPSAALVAWCVLAYLTVDFGFFHKLFQLRPEDNAIYRAAAESAVAASLVIFMQTFLKLGAAPSFVRMLLGLWTAGQLALVAIAVIDPRLASTFARLSFPAIGAIGSLTTVALAMRGRDRALALMPTWLFFLVWVFGAAVVLTGRLATEIAGPGLVAGLVLIVVSIGFTVTQFAFRSLEPVYGGTGSSEQQLSSVAVDGAGAATFQWHVRRNEIVVSPLIEGLLGLPPGELSTKVPEFLKHVHEADRERLRLVMWAVQERAGAAIHTHFRLRHADNSARWFDLEASSIPGPDPRETRFVGLLRDVTETRRAHERLVHDAVHCSLTGLANRALFLDRLKGIMARARTDDRVRPAILLIDLDKFKSINTQLGLPVGDSLLLTIARRLQRHLSGRDSLARVGGDQFAILMEAERDPADFAREAERIRRAVRAPIKIAGQDIVITASLGIAIYDGEEMGDAGLLTEAEIAVYRAKQAGADRIELFRSEMRADREVRTAIESDLRKAIDKNQLRLLYQPVIYLPTEELAGFEAMPRFEHPTLGTIDPASIVPVDPDSDLAGKVLSYVLARATQDAVRWQKELPRTDRALFVSINVSNRTLLRPELAREVRQVLDQRMMAPGTLRLELSESLVMQNPEQAGEVLELLRGTGADLALDEFGTGYSSLAYLQRFPFDTIKIDRSIIEAAGGGEAAGAAMVRSMVALSHELNRKVVADGVEDPEDAAFLRGIGCAYAQGFYYGDPMPDREVLQLLKLVRKSERNLKPRGVFRMTMKRTRKAGAPGAAEPAQPVVAEAAMAEHGADRSDAAGTAAVASKANGKANAKAKPPRGAMLRRSAANGRGAPGAADAPPPPMPPVPVFEPPGSTAAMAQSPYVEPHLPPPFNPLSSLQAGLDALAGRQPPPPEPPQPPPQPAGSLDELSAVFNTPPPAPRLGVRPYQPQPQPPQHNSYAVADAFATLAAAVQAADTPPSAMPPPPAIRPESMTRLRAARPAPDLSKLPPGLAASLAKLAGSGSN